MIDLNDIVRVVAEWDGPAGALAQMVWHYKVEVGNDEDPDDVLADIIANFESAWANIEGMITNTWVSTTLELYKRDVANHAWDGVSIDTSALLDGGMLRQGFHRGQPHLSRYLRQRHDANPENTSWG